ncbi:MAG: CDP-alcohol phosphatidyltransferase family protein [Bacteroidaceae bacterium]|nr:CDP-alcohol phosphatidyltransferase family protein [Bacteroidaceae bacterium]
MSTQLNATFKSQDTEEWLDIHFTRPIGLLWAKFFRALGIHPNVVTIISIILGVAAGFCFYSNNYLFTIVGILLLMWANFYDSADGQLARMTGQKTQWGRILDGFAGDVWFFTIYAVLCLRLQNQPLPFGLEGNWDVWIWLLAACSGLKCHAEQCRLADYYRNIHLYFLKGKQGSELHDSATMEQEFKTISWRKAPAWKVFQFFYIRYTKAQEKTTPKFQALRKTLNARYADEIPASLRNQFRAQSLPLMKWTNILTFNTRALVLYASLLIMQPWIYFIAELTVFNALYHYMRIKHESICEHTIKNLN